MEHVNVLLWKTFDGVRIGKQLTKYVVSTDIMLNTPDIF